MAPTDSVDKAVKLMAQRKVGALMVMKDNAVVGVFSERDLARNMAHKGFSNPNIPVSEMMSRQVYYVNPTMTMVDCMKFMTEKRIRHLPVMENNKLVGVVSIGDVVNSIIQDQESEIKDLENYIIGGTFQG